jgi:hypothetical protein
VNGHELFDVVLAGGPDPDLLSAAAPHVEAVP